MLMTADPIVSSFDRLVGRAPGRTLIASSGRTASAGDVHALSHTLALILAEALLPRDSLVGLVAPNGPAFLAGLLAQRRSGLATLLLDPAAPEVEARRVATELGADATLICRTGWPQSRDDWSLARFPRPDTPTPRPIGQSIVKVTSGSTGRPRGVAASAECLVADEEGLFSTMGLREDDRILAAIPMGHSYGLSSAVLPALVRGLVLVVPSGPNPLAPLDAARSLGATFFPTVPAYLSGIVRLERPELWPRSLRLVISAGAPLSPAVAAAFREAHGQAVHSFYGASECGGICYDRDGGAAERGTVGTPVDGVRVSLEPAAGMDGGEGAVIVESAATALSYVPDPDPQLGAGRFRAGDRAAWLDGELQLRGRIDDLINVRGKKVDPGEVERILTQLEGVREAAVFGVPSPVDGGQTVRAVVACRPGGLTRQQVLVFCRARLAEHKVPRSVRLVGELPRTDRGKIDRQALLFVADDSAAGERARD